MEGVGVVRGNEQVRSQKEGNGKYPHGFALSDITIMFLHPKILHHRKVWSRKCRIERE